MLAYKAPVCQKTSEAVDSKNNSFSILYLNPHIHKRLHTITLLILDNARDP